ncbi:MAG: TM0996/MTH895 family glutaredoxin-like protein [Clostridia bacterium]|nr:TM0996/MTH895 family glutaredoxin-like protein [Clostridia bacterium]
MDIKVLGSGCTKCSKLESLVKEVVSEQGLDATVTKVQDIKEIFAYGVMKTPALVVDEKVVLAGSLPSKSKIEELLK